MSWMTVCDDMKVLSEGQSYVALTDVYQLALHAGMQPEAGVELNPMNKSWEEVNAMLRHFHSLGVIIYYGDHEGLDQLIVLNPQWVVDRITDVIREHTVTSEVLAHERSKDIHAKAME